MEISDELFSCSSKDDSFSSSYEEYKYEELFGSFIVLLFFCKFIFFCASSFKNSINILLLFIV